MQQAGAPRDDPGEAAKPSARHAGAPSNEDGSVPGEPDPASAYVVKAGDTLAGIAAAHGLSVLDLLEANPGVGGNLACLRSSEAWVRAAAGDAARSNPPLERFLGTLRWYWLLHGCFGPRRNGGAARERALLDSAQVQLAAAGRSLVDDIVRRASTADDVTTQALGARRRDAPRGAMPD